MTRTTRLFRLAAAGLLTAAALSVAHAGAYEDFFRAVDTDDDRTVRSLLERGFDPNAANEKGQVGLYLAFRGESPKVAAALMEHPQLKVDAANAVSETPLMMAALRGQLAPAQRLIERGAQIDRDGWTPLHYAACGPDAKVVALLLDRGARLEATSPAGETPLLMAARWGHEDSVKVLLARGADPRARTPRGQSAADLARSGGREPLAATLERAAR